MAPRDTHREVRQGLGTQDRIAIAVTGAIGTMWAVYALALIMAAWMLVQVWLGLGAFDPYPFAFLLFLGNIVQLLLLPLLLVGQNIQSRHGEARSEDEFKTVGKIFHDLEAALAHLDAQDEELLRQSRLLIGLVETLVPERQRVALLDSVGVLAPPGRSAGSDESG
jgi:uncharacterized membrane protein